MPMWVWIFQIGSTMPGWRNARYQALACWQFVSTGAPADPRMAAGGAAPTLRGRCRRHLVAHDHEPLLEPRDRLPRDHVAGAYGLVGLGALESREHPPRTGHEPHEQPSAIRRRMRAQVVHAPEPLAAFSA